MSIAPAETFQHEALLYDGTEDFVEQLAPFLREGVRAGDGVMVAVTADKIELLREELNGDADGVDFVDMAEIGRNPARIIPAWRDFADRRRPGQALRGVGEPIWAGRREEEIVECQLHESLLNVAFGGAESFRLICPYDVGALDAGVIHEAHCSHPTVIADDALADSQRYRGHAHGAFMPFEAPLPMPPAARSRLSFDEQSLRDVRELVAAYAAEAGLGDSRAREAVLAVHEIATNSVRHGGGSGVVHMWCDQDGFVAEVRDRGRIADPLVGRYSPCADTPGGWGCYVANQLCDLTQMRSDADGTIVRLYVREG